MRNQSFMVSLSLGFGIGGLAVVVCDGVELPEEVCWVFRLAAENSQFLGGDMEFESAISHSHLDLSLLPKFAPCSICLRGSLPFV